MSTRIDTCRTAHPMGQGDPLEKLATALATTPVIIPSFVRAALNPYRPPGHLGERT
ncbi:MAG: hypothetical protein JNM91_14120 [Flavobacteriales bacterium]|nr:hypothetical protein [Flavobacteriales bacterium]